MTAMNTDRQRSPAYPAVDRHEQGLPSAFLWSHGKWRAEAYRYGGLEQWFGEAGIQDGVQGWQHLDYTLHDGRLPPAYQTEGLAAWQKAGLRGTIVLPTGSGKSYVAIRAIQLVNGSAVVVVPTLELLHQWFRLLSHAFHTEVGVFYGSEKMIRPITVVTYASFGTLMAQYGDHYRLLIADETHHLVSPTYAEGALMSIATARLGLTATYPSEEQQSEGRWRLDQLLGGPIVYALTIDDLAGEQLADYRTQRIRVELTPDEREAYDRENGLYLEFINRRNLRRDYKAGWFQEFQKRAAKDSEARAALLARQRANRLLAGCQGKLQIVDDLLREHLTDQVLIFTETNDVAYRIAKQYLIPVITHHTGAAERKEIVDGFQEQKLKCIVACAVLDEGIDLPLAKIAIVLGGTAGARQYIQRLGRVLRRVENKQAVLYEVLVRGTSEEGKVQRRRAAAKRQGERDAHIRFD